MKTKVILVLALMVCGMTMTSSAQQPASHPYWVAESNVNSGSTVIHFYQADHQLIGEMRVEKKLSIVMTTRYKKKLNGHLSRISSGDAVVGQSIIGTKRRRT